ncbi:MBL fold metallo-hydrolase [Anaerocolumna cellulosilytica]|uniref:MBL fold metallo-hydrolase n=1 Tax=Anaerocolumna cellulosilytica TaxID=433286 RepID=UPI001617769D|nr:MBL fold metallo-hydrolase [Anaerocolumna cellulosilytica]MBB5196713.1 glyoxylase-like metal-dependent hydrolase (beta-lactamase superfamily II) [Anaerocolumna cellulosilytica]
MNIVRCKWANYINYTYIVRNMAANKCIIIDPAWEMKKILFYINLHNLGLEAILLTHAHYDHTNLVEALVDIFNTDVYISGIEADRYKFNCKNLNYIEDAQKVSLSSFQITGILTPGHTLGSMCYLIGDNLFTGDTLFYEGCGICANYAAASSMYDSFKRLKQIIGKDTFIYPGHCYGTYPGQPFLFVLRDNIYLNIEDRSKFIDFRLNGSKKNIFNFK